MAKVGLLINSLSNGGAERVVSRLSGILSGKNEVYLIVYDSREICYEFSGELINMNIRAAKSNGLKKLLLPIRRARMLRKIKKEKQLDACISFMSSANIVNLLARTPGCRTITSIRNYISLELGDSLVDKGKNFLLRKLFSRADAVIPVSEEIREDILQRYELEPEKVVTIYNPYDTASIAHQQVRAMSREHEEFLQSGRCIVSVGRNMHQKGFWHLLKAFKLVHDQIPEARLAIVGRNELPEQTEGLLKELKLEDAVLLTGFQKNPFAYIDRGEVYVLSSLYEGFPNSLVEAMCCHKPVIAANCCSGPKEILTRDYKHYEKVQAVTEVEYGILVPEMTQGENWHAALVEPCDRMLAQAILRLMEDPELRKHYADKALERAGIFTFSACAEQYQRVIDGEQPGSREEEAVPEAAGEQAE